MMNIMREVAMNGDLWTALGGASLTVLALLVLNAVVRRRQLHLAWAALCLAGIVAGVLGTAVFAPHPDDVVVTANDAVLLLSPFEGADPKGALRLGEDVRVKELHDAYAYVKSAAGEKGWVAKTALTRHVGPRPERGD